MNGLFTKWIFSKLTQNLHFLGLFKRLNEIMHKKHSTGLAYCWYLLKISVIIIIIDAVFVVTR